MPRTIICAASIINTQAVSKDSLATVQRFASDFGLSGKPPAYTVTAQTGAIPECGICLIESHHSDHFDMDWTLHPFFKILFVLKGAGRLLIQGKSYRLGAHEIVIIPRGLRHRIVDSPQTPLSLYALCLQNGAIEVFCQRLDHKILRTSAPMVLGSVIKNILRNLLYEQLLDDAGTDLVMTGLVLELLGALMRSQSRKVEKPILGSSPRLLSRARVAAYISTLGKDFYRSQNLDHAAEHAGLKPRRFSQLFHEVTGSSWPTFVRTKRIGHAKRLLRGTDRSIVAVCFECGFEDLSSFYRAFQSVEKTSPKAWRDRK